MSSPAPRRKKSVGRRISEVLVAALTIAFPALMIAFVPVGPVVEKLDVFLDRLGPFAMIVFAVLYVIDAIALGPAWLFALVAGLAFGLWKGALLVWASATVAAAGAFLIARYFARHRIEKWAKKNEKYEAVDRAITKHGWKVVLLLRVSPMFPYTIANYLYGLTAVDFAHYVIATAIGIIPMVAIYVSLGAAGREAALAAIQGGETSKLEYVVLAVGVLFTIGAAVLITREARRELAAMRLAKKEEGSVLNS